MNEYLLNFQPCILEVHQKKYFDNIKMKSGVDAIRLREFVIKPLGDTSGYQRDKGSSTDDYHQIHKKIRELIKKLYDNLQQGDSTPMFNMAYSLGGQIIPKLYLRFTEAKSGYYCSLW